MPKKKSAFEKHIKGKKFNKEAKLFFKGQKKKSRKMWRKMRYLAGIVHDHPKSSKIQKSILLSYLKS
jgi:hypothetical protein